MSNQRRARSQPAPARPASSTNRLLLGGAAVLAVLVGGVMAFGAGLASGRGSTERGLAATAAGSVTTTAPDATVRVIAGGIHTVHHTIAPLPAASTPRGDGRPTLVWFSGTWCEVCETMAPYAQSTFGQFEGRMAFAEKSVDHDRAAASRFAIRGTPTFVLIDAQGRELSRFFYQPDATRLRQTVDAALKQAGF